MLELFSYLLLPRLPSRQDPQLVAGDEAVPGATRHLSSLFFSLASFLSVFFQPQHLFPPGLVPSWISSTITGLQLNAKTAAKRDLGD